MRNSHHFVEWLNAKTYSENVMQMHLIISESAADWLNKFGAGTTEDKVTPGVTSIRALVTMSITVFYTDMIITTCKLPTPLSATQEEDYVRSAFNLSSQK